MSDTDELKFHCASCYVAEDCRHAFGKYYEGKSRGGVGCNCPFPGYRRSRPIYASSQQPRRK